MTSIILFDFDYISIHSVARPRLIYAHLMTGNYVFQSTRSQDRDNVSILAGTLLKNFNPLGRKTETPCHNAGSQNDTISIHSVARPRRTGKLSINYLKIFQSTRSQDRDYPSRSEVSLGCISIHSVARPRRANNAEKEGLSSVFQSTRSQDRDFQRF